MLQSVFSWSQRLTIGCAFFVFSLSIAFAAEAPNNVTVLKAARLFDGKAKALVTNGVVIVQGNVITDAGSNLPIPSGAQVIDLGDATLSPGFMDAHTHLTFDFTGNFNERRLKLLELNVSEHAQCRAERTLHHRSWLHHCARSRQPVRGSHEFVDVALRNAIAKGIIIGGPLLVVTTCIVATAGHFDGHARFRDSPLGPDPTCRRHR